jgi:hypothetical protein
MSAKHPDATYVSVDPFFGDESELTCRNVTMRVARKTHRCFSLEGRQDHEINRGDRYRFESALVDGDFWGNYKICLPCMDRLIDDEGDDEGNTDA